jgi:hypothetical protein
MLPCSGSMAMSIFPNFEREAEKPPFPDQPGCGRSTRSQYPIAAGRSRGHKADMARRIVLVAAVALCGCGPSGNAITASRSDAEGPVASLPFDSSSGFLRGYLLKVPRQGGFLWNGQPVGEAVLRDYLRQYARVPNPADRLSVSFEPGVAQGRADRVRRQVIASGLCAQHRCAEVGWDVQRAVVN